MTPCDGCLLVHMDGQADPYSIKQMLADIAGSVQKNDLKAILLEDCLTEHLSLIDLYYTASRLDTTGLGRETRIGLWCPDVTAAEDLRFAATVARNFGYDALYSADRTEIEKWLAGVPVIE